METGQLLYYSENFLADKNEICNKWQSSGNITKLLEYFRLITTEYENIRKGAGMSHIRQYYEEQTTLHVGFCTLYVACLLCIQAVATAELTLIR